MADLTSVLDITSSSIQNILNNRSTSGVSATNTVSDAGTFDAIYNSAINMVSSTNDYLTEASEAEVAYATGELTSTHELAVIEQKANLSLQYTVAIKNQLLSAYKEIMQIQI